MIWAMKKLGVPYPEGYEKQANTDLMNQANSIRINLKIDKIKTAKDKEIIALVAYLQRLGKDIKTDVQKETASK
jgi:cytochrome c oxidase cbb3-type subunit I/II